MASTLVVLASHCVMIWGTRHCVMTWGTYHCIVFTAAEALVVHHRVLSVIWGSLCQNLAGVPCLYQPKPQEGGVCVCVCVCMCDNAVLMLTGPQALAVLHHFGSVLAC